MKSLFDRKFENFRSLILKKNTKRSNFTKLGRNLPIHVSGKVLQSVLHRNLKWFVPYLYFISINKKNRTENSFPTLANPLVVFAPHHCSLPERRLFLSFNQIFSKIFWKFLQEKTFLKTPVNASFFSLLISCFEFWPKSLNICPFFVIFVTLVQKIVN